MSARHGTAGMPKAAARDKRGLDFYASPYAALPPLLAAERRKLPRVLWEPACGNGALVIPLRNRGFVVTATDIVDRGCPDAHARDFFDVKSTHALGIVTNPPFDGSAGGIEDFAEHAARLSPYVAILARLAWFEGAGRHSWWGRMGLRRIIKIADRLPMMHREGYEGPKLSNSGQCFGWFIFEPGMRPKAFTPVYSRLWKTDIKRFPMTEADVPPAAKNLVLPLFDGVAA
jgi:hypothetical protein